MVRRVVSLLSLLLLFLPTLAVATAEPPPPPPPPPKKPQNYAWVMDVCVRHDCFKTGCASLRDSNTGNVTTTAGACVSSCADGGTSLNGTSPREFDAALRVLRWDCASDCKYRCMTAVERARRREGLEPKKYYGKWPFARVLGTQEIVSAVASVANGGAHAWRLPTLTRAAKRRMRFAALWLGFTLVNINAWIWSVLFHCRELPFTHYMDYLGVNIVFFYALYAAFVRAFEPSARRAAALAVAFVAAAVAHVRHVNPPRQRYRYEYNMRAMFALIGAFWVVMLWWAFRGFRFRSRGGGGGGGGGGGWRGRGRHPGRRWLLAFGATFHVAALGEVFDYPPAYHLVDSHAVWHCVTPGCIWFWYLFVKEDLKVAQTATAKAKKNN